MEAIEPHLPTLIPYLINTLNDPKVVEVLSVVSASLTCIVASCAVNHLLDPWSIRKLVHSTSIRGA